MSNTSKQVLAHLRTLKVQERVMPTLEQIQAALAAVRSAEPMHVTLRKPEFAGWNAADLVSVVESLGKFLAQSRKAAVSGYVVDWDQSGMLFPLSQDEIALLRARVASSKSKAPKAGNLLPRGATSQSIVVHIPRGWTSSELGRDVAQSVATAVVTPVTDAEIVRFIERHYRKATIGLTADHVYLLVWLAEQGMLNRLTELTDAEGALAAVLVKAWDLLEVSADDAQASVAQLVEAAGRTDWDAAELADACNRCSWLRPGEVGRVSQTVTRLTEVGEDAALRAIAQRRLASFAQNARNTGMLNRVSTPDAINIAHAQLICDQAGLLSHEAEEKEIRADIREKLTAMGLVNDLDREIGEGVRAWKLGVLEEFYTTRSARAEGDLEWSSSWEQVLELAGAAS